MTAARVNVKEKVMERDGLVIVAGGSGRRFGGNKLLELLDGIPVFLWAMRSLGPLFAPDCRVLVAPEHELDEFQRLAGTICPGLPFLWTTGGERRSDSVLSGLEVLPRDLECVAIHDAARPLATAELLRRVMERAREIGGAIPGRSVTDTLKRTSVESLIAETVSRDFLYRVETPQCFRLNLLLEAYALPDSGDFTDDAAVMEHAGLPVAVVPHEQENMKLTYRTDLPYLEWLVAGDGK